MSDCNSNSSQFFLNFDFYQAYQKITIALHRDFFLKLVSDFSSGLPARFFPGTRVNSKTLTLTKKLTPMSKSTMERVLTKTRRGLTVLRYLFAMNHISTPLTTVITSAVSGYTMHRMNVTNSIVSWFGPGTSVWRGKPIPIEGRYPLASFFYDGMLPSKYFLCIVLIFDI